MRRDRLALSSTILLCALVMAFTQHTARASDVLLPSSTTGSDGASNRLPDLGLSAPTPQAPLPSSSDAQKKNADISTPIPTGPTAAEIKAATDLSKLITSPDSAEDIKNLRPGELPTKIIHKPDQSRMLAEAYKDRPNVLSIGFSSQSLFGARDVAAIHAKIGLSRNQIPDSCLLTVRGLVQTSKDASMIDGGNASQVQVRYDGMIKGYMMNAVALCLATHLPPDAGFLTETDGRYVVPLHFIRCPPPNRQTSMLTITYDGTDKAQCVYQ
ncbi:MAG: hypothetical protein KGI97_07705 [Alphaproteobacteria bacterium]|nr:hypothetical protein [Alphaproteobacteria bacterium]